MFFRLKNVHVFNRIVILPTLAFQKWNSLIIRFFVNDSSGIKAYQVVVKLL